MRGLPVPSPFAALSSMKKFLSLVIILFLATAFLPLSAQQNRCKVTGIVSAANGHTLTYASVFVSHHDSVIAGTLTNQEGHFELEIAQTKDSCFLTVVFMGIRRSSCLLWRIYHKFNWVQF